MTYLLRGGDMAKRKRKTILYRGKLPKAQQAYRMKTVMKAAAKYRQMGLARGPALKKAWRDVKVGHYD